MLIWFLFLLSLLHLPCREFIEVGTDLKFDFYSKSSYITEAKSSEKAKITIAIMLPQDYIRLRNFNVCIKKEMDRINRGNWSFNKHFYLDSYTIIIHKNFNDIVQTICALLNTQSNTAIYINYNDFSPIEAINSRLFLKFATYINMPVMTYIPNAYATNRPRKNEIQLAPTMFHQVEAMMSLMVRYDWLKYSIIVTDHSGSHEFLRAAENLQYSHLSQKKFKILSVIKLKLKKKQMNHSEIVHKFKFLAPETRVIILHCHIDETNLIFEIANHLGLMTYEYMWILTKNVIDSQLYNNYRFSHFPMGSLALWSNNSPDGMCDTIVHNSMRIWASALENFYNSISKDQMNVILPHTKCWNETNLEFNTIKYHYGKNFHNNLLKASIDNGDKGSMKFNQSGVLDSVEFKIWNLNQKYEWKEVGSWNNKEILMDDLVWPGKKHKPPLGKPIKFHLKVVTLEEPPFVIFKDPLPEGTCPSKSLIVRVTKKENALNRSDPTQFRCASGFYVDLMIELSDKLQFTFDIYEVEDKAWGGKSKNGEWNGLMKDLITNKADLAMTSLKITTERIEIIDFSIPFMETGIAIVVSLRPGTISTTAFLKPYDYLIWIMLLLVTLHSVAISVYLFEWIVIKFRNKDKNVKKVFEFVNDPKLKKSDPNAKAFTIVKLDDSSKFTFGKSLWLVWVLLFRAATKTQQPSGFASKFMVNIWATLCLAFTASYTANLAAFMIIREEYPDLKGVEDPRLTNPYGYKPAYKFGTVSSGSTEEIIKKNHPLMYDYMKKYMAHNASHGIDLVKKRKLDAFLYDAVILDYRAGQDDGCKLRVVGSWYSMTGYGIALPKGSKYKEMIDRKIIEYSHSGELERTQRFWFAGTCKNVEQNSRNSDQFGLLQSSSVFILLLAGIIIAVLILFADVLFSLYFRKKFTKVWFYEKPSRKMSKMNARIVANLLKTKQNGKLAYNYNSDNKLYCCENAHCSKEKKQLKEELVYLRSKYHKQIELNKIQNNFSTLVSKNDQVCYKSAPNFKNYKGEIFQPLLENRFDQESFVKPRIKNKFNKLNSENLNEFVEFVKKRNEFETVL